MKWKVRKLIEEFVREHTSGRPERNFGRWWTRAEAKRVKAMLDRDVPLKEICREFDATPNELRSLRDRMGWEIRVRDPEGRMAAVAELSREGRSDGEVADAIGCSRPTVVACRKKLNLPAQRKRGGHQPGGSRM